MQGFRVFEEGYTPYLSVRDPISTWMSVEDALYAIIDRLRRWAEITMEVVEDA